MIFDTSVSWINAKSGLVMRSAVLAMVGLSLTSVALADPIDTDGDGYPDEYDLYPNDPTRWDDPIEPLRYWYVVRPIDGTEQIFSGSVFESQWVDADGDEIPDFDDPYPIDSTNNSTYWDGEGYYLVEGNFTYYENRWMRTDTLQDSDNDGLPDSIDIYPFDSTNSTYYWFGGTFRVDGQDQYFEPRYVNSLQDEDNDGIPDQIDPYLLDSTNNEPPPPEDP